MDLRHIFERFFLRKILIYGHKLRFFAEKYLPNLRQSAAQEAQIFCDRPLGHKDALGAEGVGDLSHDRRRHLFFFFEATSFMLPLSLVIFPFYKEKNMEHLTLTTFKQKICECGIQGGEGGWRYKGTVPCIIDFYADWCGPCRALAPVLEQIAGEYAGRIEIYKVDTEKETELASMFGIRSIPTLLFVPKEGEPQMSAGAMPKSSLEETIKDIFGVDKK